MRWICLALVIAVCLACREVNAEDDRQHLSSLRGGRRGQSLSAVRRQLTGSARLEDAWDDHDGAHNSAASSSDDSSSSSSGSGYGEHEHEGGEGGAHELVWPLSFSLAMPPAYLSIDPDGKSVTGALQALLSELLGRDLAADEAGASAEFVEGDPFSPGRFLVAQSGLTLVTWTRTFPVAEANFLEEVLTNATTAGAFASLLAVAVPYPGVPCGSWLEVGRLPASGKTAVLYCQGGEAAGSGSGSGDGGAAAGEVEAIPLSEPFCSPPTCFQDEQGGIGEDAVDVAFDLMYAYRGGYDELTGEAAHDPAQVAALAPLWPSLLSLVFGSDHSLWSSTDMYPFVYDNTLAPGTHWRWHALMAPPDSDALAAALATNTTLQSTAVSLLRQYMGQPLACGTVLLLQPDRVTIAQQPQRAVKLACDASAEPVPHRPGTLVAVPALCDCVRPAPSPDEPPLLQNQTRLLFVVTTLVPHPLAACNSSALERYADVLLQALGAAASNLTSDAWLECTAQHSRLYLSLWNVPPEAAYDWVAKESATPATQALLALLVQAAAGGHTVCSSAAQVTFESSRTAQPPTPAVGKWYPYSSPYVSLSSLAACDIPATGSFRPDTMYTHAPALCTMDCSPWPLGVSLVGVGPEGRVYVGAQLADPGGEGESSPAVDGLFAALASALPFPAAFGTDPVTEVSASATTRLLDMTATPDWLSEGDVWEGLASNATLLAPLVRALPAPPPCKALLGLRLLAFYQDWGEPCLGCVQAADHPLLVLGCLSAFEDQELASGSTYLRAGGSTGYRLLDVPEMCDICTAA